MKLVTYQIQGSQRVGALIRGGSHLIDLATGLEAMGEKPSSAFSSMLALVESGEAGLALASKVVEDAPESAVRRVSDVKLLAPLPRPVVLRDCGCFVGNIKDEIALMADAAVANITDPAAKAMKRADVMERFQLIIDRPTYYLENVKTISGPEDEVQFPSETAWLDFELEFAAVIGKKGKDIKKGTAIPYIFGYTIFNDWSWRDVENELAKIGIGLGKGKDFDGSNGLGPCITTADEIGDPYNLKMVVRINGEEFGGGNSSSMYWHFDDVIEQVSIAETILPGEVLGSGTVPGASGELHGFHLKPGDVVELEVEKIGVLRNRVVAR